MFERSEACCSVFMPDPMSSSALKLPPKLPYSEVDTKGFFAIDLIFRLDVTLRAVLD